MNTTVTCRDVRTVTGKSNSCLIVATQEREEERTIDPIDASNFLEMVERLHSQGIVLGGDLQRAQRSGSQGSPPLPIEIIARDEHHNEHRLPVDSFEEYSLSSGSTLYYLSIHKSPRDCSWLVGRTLELNELVGERDKLASLTKP